MAKVEREMMGLLSSKTPLFHLFLFSFVVLLLACSSRGEPLYQICSSSSGYYTSNSTYEANLVNHLLPSLSSNGWATGSSNDTKGDGPNRVYGLVLCRGDVQAIDCKSCLQIARRDVGQLCPYSKGAIVWYDYCLLRYSNQLFFSSIDGSEIYMRNEQNVTNSDVFKELVDVMMNALVNYTVKNASAPRLFSIGEIYLNADFKSPLIYGLTQCTRDLSADQCSQCLQGILSQWKSFSEFSGTVGARILRGSCNFRYEKYSFYNSTALVSIPSPMITTTPTTNSTNTTMPTTNTTNTTTPTTNSPIPGVLPPGDSPTSQANKKNLTGTVLAISISVVVASVLISVVFICFWRRRRRRRKAAKKIHWVADPREITTIESLLVDLSTLRVATDNFSDSNKLGEGGFGAVYKGVLSDGQEIAVKRLSRRSEQGLEELKNEVLLLAKLQHRNLVRILGVCLEEEEQEKLLIYEYLLNRSLDTFLFDPTKHDLLNWGTRYKIIGGIARGLLYLHEDSQLKIIHRDLKTSNILLDADMNPKISDFGLARLFGGNQIQASTNRVVGTYGYMAPEYAMHGHFSNKSDVFSFGVLVLELVTGQKNSRFSNCDGSRDLLSYVWEHWTKGTILEVLDQSLSEHSPQGEVLRSIQIALLCVQESPEDRPTMSSVVHMLNSYYVTQIPSRPAFLRGYTRVASDVLVKGSESSSNGLSITELDPR